MPDCHGTGGDFVPTGRKWWHRARVGLRIDRSSAIPRHAGRHPPELVARLCARRRELRFEPHILVWDAGLARSSLYAILQREALGLAPGR